MHTNAQRAHWLQTVLNLTQGRLKAAGFAATTALVLSGAVLAASPEPTGDSKTVPIEGLY
jgi:hypothetical protein